MTDEEIIQLAEKTRNKKYCDKYHAISGCNSECPFSNGYDYGCNVAYSEYQQAFLDGFKAAMEYINQIPHFLLKHDNNTEIIEKFRDSPELYQTYLSEMEKNIQCIINGILSREK